MLALIVSMLIGLACLRLKGPYVALLTLAIAQVIYLLIINDTECFTTNEGGCMPLFGGVRGIGKFGDLGFRDLFGSKFIVANYFLGLTLLAAAFGFSVIVIRGPLGLAFRALRTIRVTRCRAESVSSVSIVDFRAIGLFHGARGRGLCRRLSRRGADHLLHSCCSCSFSP